MSSYSVGKNEIRSLLEKEARMSDELKSLTNDSGSKIHSFKAISINNELEKIRNKLKVLSFGNSSSDDIA